MKKYRGRIITAVVIILLLTASFFAGTEDRGRKSLSPLPEDISEAVVANENDTTENNIISNDTEEDTLTSSPTPPEESTETEQPKISTADVPIDNVPQAVVPEATPTQTPVSEPDTSTALTCTLSVRCDTALNSTLSNDKKAILPKNGVIFKEQTVTFYEGESVFNVLLREMKKNKIHMEYSNTPIYNSAYIEGVGNLYEFDCGELSGWMYRVNGTYPSYGCSRYYLKNGDKIEWLYTCDLGADIGGRNDLSDE